MLTDMEMGSEVRRRVRTDEIGKRQAGLEYEIHWQTLKRILSHEQPPGFRTRVPRGKPKLGPVLPIIHQILDADRAAPWKQRHTAERIFQRLRDEHGYTGCVSVVRAAVAEWRWSRAEVFVPLKHPPGEAQVDFGQAEVVIAGRTVTAAYVVMALPYSDAFFVRIYTAVKEAVREMKVGRKEVFLPLPHPAGEAQVDYRFAEAVIAGVLTKLVLTGRTEPLLGRWGGDTRRYPGASSWVGIFLSGSQ